MNKFYEIKRFVKPKQYLETVKKKSIGMVMPLNVQIMHEFFQTDPLSPLTTKSIS